MFDRELVLNSLQQVQTLINTIMERTAGIVDVDGFYDTPSGMVLLDAICMNLIALGEATKNLDKVSNGELLSHYPQIQWDGIMRMRDKIAHHYFEVDADVVLLTVKEDIPQVQTIVAQIVKDIS